MFLRDLPHLCQRMKRPTSQEIKKIKREPHCHPMPDFYAISRNHPRPEGPGGSAALPPTEVSSQTVVTNSASSGSAASRHFPMLQGLNAQQFSHLGGSSAAAGLAAFLQHMSAGPSSGSTAVSMSTGAASNAQLPNGMRIGELAAMIQKQQQQQQQTLPSFETAPQHSSGSDTDAILALLGQQVMGSPAPAQPPAATASLPQGIAIEHVLAILRQQVASASAPTPASTPSVASLPPALVAALLARQQNLRFHNSAPASSSMPPPFAAAPSGGLDISTLLRQVREILASRTSPHEPQQDSANSSVASFLSANTLQASNVKSALLVQLSQQLGTSAGSAGGGCGGSGGNSNSQQLALLPLLQGLSSSAVVSGSSPPIAAAAPPPALPSGLNIQDLLLQLGNASRNNSMGGSSSSNNNKNNRNQDQGNHWN